MTPSSRTPGDRLRKITPRFSDEFSDATLIARLRIGMSTQNLLPTPRDSHKPRAVPKVLSVKNKKPQGEVAPLEEALLLG
jgi:hypothetical protein